MNRRIPALLLGHHKLLQTSGGGVQICNREYVASLEAAGFQLQLVSFDYENELAHRALNRLFPKASPAQVPPGLYQRVADAVRQSDAETIFFALDLFSKLSLKLRRTFPNVRQILLSHGVECIDSTIDQQIRRRTGTENRPRIASEWALGRQLLNAAEQRRWIDAVLTLSPLEVEVEKWLGSSKVLWVPRTISEPRLDVRPVDQRVGCVSTLDHPPNMDGLVRLFDALAESVSREFRFRLVGQPLSDGNALATRYSFVEYLGPLDDAQLRSEAKTWCCFVHPLFVYAKGCSTKLAFGLGWGLPVATTAFGARGYVWNRHLLPLADTPAELARFVLDRCFTDHFAKHQKETEFIRALTPNLKTIGEDIRNFLLVCPP